MFNIMQYFKKKSELSLEFNQLKNYEIPKESPPSPENNIDFEIPYTLYKEELLLIFKSEVDMTNERRKYFKNKSYKVSNKDIVFPISMIDSFKEKYQNYPFKEIMEDGEIVGFKPIGFFIETINNSIVQNIHF